MSDLIPRLLKELPEKIERLRDELEQLSLHEYRAQAIRGEIAAYRAILDIIKPTSIPMVGQPAGYGLTGGPAGY